ncbi:MAG: RraA family protein [Desulfotomaculales bacterium]
MTNREISDVFAELSTPMVADACVRLGLPLRFAPPGIRPLISASRIDGRVVPARHYGSVDVFLEAMMGAEAGDILVIDNGGRRDEGCVGDLTALEAQACGLSGIVVWGCHRDTEELLSIGLPVFSYGTCPAGPRRLDPPDPKALESARFGDFEVGRDDLVFADADGVLFVPGSVAEEVLSVARAIHDTERRQAEAVRAGKLLREQLHFEEYLARRATDPSYTFRRHLRLLRAAIEE